MSDRTATRSPSLMSPIAIPATGVLIGTPPSISDRMPPQTEAIDELPFDSRISETMRMTYGNSFSVGSTRAMARSARLPWPTSRRLAPRSGLVSPVENGGEVVGGKEPLLVVAVGGPHGRGCWVVAA